MDRGKQNPYNRNKMRNLKQYKDLDDSEFEDILTKRETLLGRAADFEKRINLKLEEFENDYDLSELKVNDKLSLRALIQDYLALEDYEQIAFELRSAGVDLNSIIEFEKLNNMMSSLRSDIIKLQTDLGISRKARRGDQETTVLAELDKLKARAREFYAEKMFYVYCPKCNSLLSTTWFLYPDEKGNKLQLVCRQKDKAGNECGEKFAISSKELLDMRGSNSVNIPEVLR